jgi:hypothetical protein
VTGAISKGHLPPDAALPQSFQRVTSNGFYLFSRNVVHPDAFIVLAAPLPPRGQHSDYLSLFAEQSLVRAVGLNITQIISIKPCFYESARPKRYKDF